MKVARFRDWTYWGRPVPGFGDSLGEQSPACLAGQPFGERIGEKTVGTAGFVGADGGDQKAGVRHGLGSFVHVTMVPVHGAHALDIFAADSITPRARHDWAGRYGAARIALA